MPKDRIELEEYMNPNGLPHEISPYELREVLSHPMLRRALFNASFEIAKMSSINTLQLDGADAQAIALQVKEKAGIQKGATMLMEMVIQTANGEE